MLDKVIATGAVLRMLRIYEMEEDDVMFRFRSSCFDQMVLYEYALIYCYLRSLTEGCSPLSWDTEGVGHYCNYLVTRERHQGSKKK